MTTSPSSRVKTARRLTVESPNVVDPQAWVADVLVRIADHKINDLAALLDFGRGAKLSISIRRDSALARLRPTVDTKYPLAQKCWPTKFRFFSPYTRAKCIALFP